MLALNQAEMGREVQDAQTQVDAMAKEVKFRPARELLAIDLPQDPSALYHGGQIQHSAPIESASHAYPPPPSQVFLTPIESKEASNYARSTPIDQRVPLQPIATIDTVVDLRTDTSHHSRHFRGRRSVSHRQDGVQAGQPSDAHPVIKDQGVQNREVSLSNELRSHSPVTPLRQDSGALGSAFSIEDQQTVSGPKQELLDPQTALDTRARFQAQLHEYALAAAVQSLPINQLHDTMYEMVTGGEERPTSIVRVHFISDRFSACIPCRQRKIRCSPSTEMTGPNTGTCGTCLRRGKPCTWRQESGGSAKDGARLAGPTKRANSAPSLAFAMNTGSTGKYKRRSSTQTGITRASPVRSTVVKHKRTAEVDFIDVPLSAPNLSGQGSLLHCQGGRMSANPNEDLLNQASLAGGEEKHRAAAAAALPKAPHYPGPFVPSQRMCNLHDPADSVHEDTKPTIFRPSAFIEEIDEQPATVEYAQYNQGTEDVSCYLEGHSSGPPPSIDVSQDDSPSESDPSSAFISPLATPAESTFSRAGLHPTLMLRTQSFTSPTEWQHLHTSSAPNTAINGSFQAQQMATAPLTPPVPVQRCQSATEVRFAGVNWSVEPAPSVTGGAATIEDMHDSQFMSLPASQHVADGALPMDPTNVGPSASSCGALGDFFCQDMHAATRPSEAIHSHLGYFDETSVQHYGSSWA